MQALGLIETRGLIAAVEGADAMLKAAEVTLLEKTYVGGGLVSIAVTGGVSAVKAAVEAGAAAVVQLNVAFLVSHHVIPRPHEDLDGIIVSAKPKKDVQKEAVKAVKTETIVDMEEESEALDLENIDKTTTDNIVLQYGLEKGLEILNKLKVTKLRNLAREYKTMAIAGRLISKANKITLLAEFKGYYENN
ncbi:MAG: BMC domain-containing protein [Alkaliphilus sp.]|nr:BMC domain-containing protein [Alkaliphilus sp.]